MTLDELILEQQSAAKQAAFFTARDKELRSMIYGMAFAGLEDGTQHTQALGNGYKLKGKRPISYKLSSSVDAALEAIAAQGNEGSFIADRLVKWTPSLSLTEYNALSDDMRKLIDPCITTTPGLPVIEVVEPK